MFTENVVGLYVDPRVSIAVMVRRTMGWQTGAYTAGCPSLEACSAGVCPIWRCCFLCRLVSTRVRRDHHELDCLYPQFVW
jgi:hypothetical protein